jgi:uncharacterized membrane protein YhaH (DUF805 family)
MSIERPKSVTAIAIILIFYSAFDFLLVGLAILNWLLEGQRIDLYAVVLMTRSILSVFCGIAFLRGKNWGRIVFFVLQPIVFLFGLFEQVREISKPAFMPELHFVNNLLSILWESLMPITLFGALGYFFTRPEVNAFFKKSSAKVSSKCDQEVGNRFSSPSKSGLWEYFGWYFQTVREFTTFSGCTGVAEFWIFYLINLAICMIPFTISCILIHSQSPDAPDCGPLPFLFLLPALILMPAIAARRLHDSGKSGWWLLLFFVPGVGPPIIIILLLLPSD